MPDVIKQMEDAKRRLFSVLIAEADKLDVPFSNAPDQSPWSRSAKPAMKALDNALAAVAAQVAALQRELAEKQLQYKADQDELEVLRGEIRELNTELIEAVGDDSADIWDDAIAKVRRLAQATTEERTDG